MDQQSVLLNPDWVDSELFNCYSIVTTHPDVFGANVVRVGSSLLYGAGYPKTQTIIEALGHDVRVIDMSELAKAEGAVTCCSLLFN